MHSRNGTAASPWTRSVFDNRRTWWHPHPSREVRSRQILPRGRGRGRSTSSWQVTPRAEK